MATLGVHHVTICHLSRVYVGLIQEKGLNQSLHQAPSSHVHPLIAVGHLNCVRRATLLRWEFDLPAGAAADLGIFSGSNWKWRKRYGGV